MSNDEHKALKRLAAAVLTAAVEDYRKPGAQREERRRCAKFLTRETVWHSILGLRPDVAARWLRTQIEGTKRG